MSFLARCGGALQHSRVRGRQMGIWRSSLDYIMNLRPAWHPPNYLFSTTPAMQTHPRIIPRQRQPCVPWMGALCHFHLLQYVIILLTIFNGRNHFQLLECIKYRCCLKMLNIITIWASSSTPKIHLKEMIYFYIEIFIWKCIGALFMTHTK